MNPRIVKISNVMTMAGTVVAVIYRMCLNSGVPVTDEARTVVSERGDILSPKYAPEMIAPATIPASKPCALPMPISAKPIVAIVVQELPLIIETIAQTMQEVARKNFGWIIFIP